MPFDPDFSTRRRRRAAPASVVAAAVLSVVPLIAGAPAQARSAPESFAPLVRQVTPAVVNIRTVQAVTAQAPGLPDGPMREFFERFFGRQMPRFERPGPDGDRERRREGAGSGFIIDADGHIVTNNHVVGEADEIMVTLADDRTFDAKLIGRDERTDLALLKIDADQPLPAVPWGDSDSLDVGDWVIAVGNPFGLGGTVTAGIVSARGRNIGQGPYDDFIQTDAPINRGNSGGPLFNPQGKVVGVNTAIFSTTGGSVGIGFAIPSALAESVISQLRRSGSVARGWLGVQIQQVTAEIADSLDLGDPRGALVGVVNRDSPADKGGIRTGDVIIEFAGEAIEDVRELQRVVAATEPESRISVVVFRKGRPVTLQMALGLMPDNPRQAFTGTGTGGRPDDGSRITGLGMSLAPLDERQRRRFKIAGGIRGVVVTGQPDAGRLQPGDVILSLNQEDVATVDDVRTVVRQALDADKSSILAMVYADGDSRFIALPLQDR